jgi:putative RNA 2'-phosphotransferase
MARVQHERLSKAVSYALRHDPWLYELEPDDDGWVSLTQLVDGLRTDSEFASVTRDDLVRMIENSPKQRHEIEGDRIRALYGHSLPDRLRKEPAIPPEFLYHGTARAAVATIQEQGLRPMSRQYVHLSVDEATALKVGRRKSSEVALLRISARKAANAGVLFYEGNAQVWLADRVPPDWIDIN